MHYPGDFVRRAAANINKVSNTVSSVTSTVTNSTTRRASSNSSDFRQNSWNADLTFEESILLNSKEKINLPVKLTPSKDAATTSKFAIKTGYMMKKNEQGQWQERFICTVPHIFLYYYESETSESPRGIIDLELLTNISTEGTSILKLATMKEESLRSFYFKVEDQDTMGDWVLSLMRDRYRVISEERSAYQDAQGDMSETISAAKAQTAKLEEKNRLVSEDLAAAQKLREETTAILRSSLVVLGITEEEMEQLTDTLKMAKAVKSGIVRFGAKLDEKYTELREGWAAERTKLQSEITKLNIELKTIRDTAKTAEERWQSERNELELHIRESLCRLDTTNMHLHVAISAKNAAEKKLAALGEQKRVLVKELKILRQRLLQESDSNLQLKEINEKLCSAAVALQEQLNSSILSSLLHQEAFDDDAAEEAVHQYEQQESLDGDHHVGSDGGEFVKVEGNNAIPVTRSASSITSSISAAADALQDILSKNAELGGTDLGKDEFGAGAFSSRASTDDSSVHSRQVAPHGSLAIDVNDSADSADHFSGPGISSPIPIADEDEQQRFEPLRGPGSGSQKFGKRGLLSEFLEPDVDSSLLLPATPGPSTTTTAAAGTSSQSSSFFNGALSMLSSSAADAPSSPIASPTHSQPASSSSSSFGLLSSMFSGTTSSSSASKSKDAGNRRSELNANADDENSGRLPSAMRLTCLRCAGSVEGPKFSTCKCKLPALNPQDLQPQHGSAGGRLQGLVYSSVTGVTGGMTSVAGGVLSGSSYLAGGLMKASSQSMVGLFSTHSATTTENLPSADLGLGLADNDSLSISNSFVDEVQTTSTQRSSITDN